VSGNGETRMQAARLAALGLWLVAAAAAAAPGDTLFYDNFNGNLNSWTVVSNGGDASIGNETANQGRALRLRWGNVSATSDPIAASVPAARLDVWIRRGADGFSENPDNGEDLVVEYLSSGGGWIVLETFDGGGTPGQVYTPSYDLPADALYAGLRIRFRMTGGSGSDFDYWHVDDPTVTETAPAAPISYSFEETSWTGASGEVSDGSGNGHDGTAVGGLQNDNATPAIPTNPGTCRYGDFDGVDDYIEIPDDPALDIANELTVAAWVNMRSYPSELHTIVSKDTNYEFHVDNAGHIYWWWQADNFRTNGYSLPLNEWHHVAITFRSGLQVIYVDGVPRATHGYTGTLPQNDLPLYLGTDWNFISRAFDGFIDEVYVIPRELSQAEVQTLMSETHDCGSAAAEFTISHDNYGINCLPETITVDVVDSVAGTPLLNYNAEVRLDTQSGNGTWTLVSGGGAFNDATADDGAATYDWPLGESQAVFALYYPQGPPSIDVDVEQVTDPGIRDTDAEGLLSFAPNGFTLTAAPLGNPPGAVVPFATSQTAGVPFPVYITAYGQTPGDPVCGVIEAYDGAKDLKFWFDYVDPGSGTRSLDVDGVAAAAAEGAAVAQGITFSSGQVQVTARYKDVGRLQLHVKDDTMGNTDLPNGIRGGTNDFVVRPYDFVLSDIRDAGGTANDPSVSGPSDAPFTSAGVPFSVTVTATDADGDPTPNFGREATPESVRLDTAVYAPAGGANPPVSGVTGFGAFSDGSATGTDFTWQEVGIMQMRPAVGDGDYLGAGDVVGSLSERVGRFIPDHFAATINDPIFQTACSAGQFTYEGQRFGYLPGAEPVIDVEAQSASGSRTANYTGAFFKLDTSTLQNRNYQSSGGNLDLTGLPPAGADPTVTEAAPGSGTLTFSSGAGLAFQRAETAPFQADIELAIDVVDADGVTATGAAPLGNPVTFGTAGGIVFDAGAQIRYGRIRIANAIGSELVDLPVPTVAEYYAGSSIGYVTNVDDSCTSNVSLTLSGFTEDLQAGETCALDGGSPGASGIGCPVAAPPASRFTEPPSAGDFNLSFAAPGAGNSGGAVVQATVPAWLRYDWNQALPGDENPAAQVTFGLYHGESHEIYQREVY
jgi:MSHA biogenesis protein MshQ